MGYFMEVKLSEEIKAECTSHGLLSLQPNNPAEVEGSRLAQFALTPQIQLPFSSEPDPNPA